MNDERNTERAVQDEDASTPTEEPAPESAVDTEQESAPAEPSLPHEPEDAPQESGKEPEPVPEEASSFSAVGTSGPESQPEEANLAADEPMKEGHAEEPTDDDPVVRAEEATGPSAEAPPEEPEATPESPAMEPPATEPPATQAAEPVPVAEAEGATDTAAEEKAEEPAEEEEEPLIVPPPDDGIKRRWFAIHAHSGQEGNVQRSLIVQAEQEGLSNLVTNVLVPMEEVQEFRSGEKRTSKRKFFPGYVLVQLPEHPERNPDLWHLIKNTPGVTGFIGSRTVPVPLEDDEVQGIVEEIRGERERPRQKVQFEAGERVKIIDGPFANFLGNIDEINEERGKLKVLVEIFERQTSVEVDYWQVEKI